MTLMSHFTLGLSAMRAFRLGMNVAGYNVANAYTPGFSRRRIEISTLDPQLRVDGGVLGTGVDVVDVHRIRDTFLDYGVRRENSQLGGDTARTEVLSALEPYLGEVDSAPLQDALSGFFDAFEALEVRPDETARRMDLIAKADRLAATIQQTDDAIIKARVAANRKVGEQVDRINEIVGRLKDINVRLPEYEIQGTEASDLRDERDLLLDELSSIVEINVVEDDNGQIGVFLKATGDTLLTGPNASTVGKAAGAGGMTSVTVSRSGELVDIGALLGGKGSLGAYIETRDETLVGYRDELDRLASSLITEINAIHTAGVDLDGNAGVAFFLPDPPGANAAAAIRVNPLIADDPRLVAAATDAANLPGDKTNIQNFIALREQGLASLDDRSFVAFAGDLIGDIGHDVAVSDTARIASQVIVDSLEEKRDAFTGVSLDEEAADLAKWQQSYQAAARFMQVVNEMTEVAINLGR